MHGLPDECSDVEPAMKVMGLYDGALVGTCPLVDLYYDMLLWPRSRYLSAEERDALEEAAHVLARRADGDTDGGI